MCENRMRIPVVLAFVIAVTAFTGCAAIYIDVSPRTTTVLPDQNVTILCTVGTPIQYCRFEVPSIKTAMNLNPKLQPNGGFVYYGAGLQAGQCGVTITRVLEKYNGIVNCSLGIETESLESTGQFNLLVASPPKSQMLQVSPGSEGRTVYKVGDHIHAFCTVNDSRPAANITWYLDDEPITEGLSSTTELDTLDNLVRVSQNLTRKLRPDDNGKSLRCEVQHVALNHGIKNSYQLHVKYAPIPLNDNPLDLFGFEIGKPGSVSVEFQANPKPTISWLVGDEIIREGNIDSSSRYEAESVREMGKGRYRADLHITEVQKEDTEKGFKMTAFNDQGSTEYYVVISTSAEPQGLELGAGPIIGIVVSILILLLIIFLIIYARASGRWCFAGGEHHTNYECDTESTDVESHKKKRFNVTPKFTKLFKKNKDGPVEVDIAEENNTENLNTTLASENPNQNLQEKTDGLVYAELDLKTESKPIVRKEDEKTEYAEIIYTKKDSPDKKVETA